MRRIPETEDRRVKLLTADKQRVRSMYATGHCSMRELADMWHVSKQLIVYTVNENSLARAKEYQREYRKTYRKTK